MRSHTGRDARQSQDNSRTSVKKSLQNLEKITEMQTEPPESSTRTRRFLLLLRRTCQGDPLTRIWLITDGVDADFVSFV